VFAAQRLVGVHRQLVAVYRQVFEHFRLVVAPSNPAAAQSVALNAIPSHCSRPLTTPSPHRPPLQAAALNVQSDLHARPGAA
jgi:hypothetical protein